MPCEHCTIAGVEEVATMGVASLADASNDHLLGAIPEVRKPCPLNTWCDLGMCQVVQHACCHAVPATQHMLLFEQA